MADNLDEQDLGEETQSPQQDPNSAAALLAQLRARVGPQNQLPGLGGPAAPQGPGIGAVGAQPADTPPPPVAPSPAIPQPATTDTPLSPAPDYSPEGLRKKWGAQAQASNQLADQMDTQNAGLRQGVKNSNALNGVLEGVMAGNDAASKGTFTGAGSNSTAQRQILQQASARNQTDLEERQKLTTGLRQRALDQETKINASNEKDAALKNARDIAHEVTDRVLGKQNLTNQGGLEKAALTNTSHETVAAGNNATAVTVGGNHDAAGITKAHIGADAKVTAAGLSANAKAAGGPSTKPVRDPKSPTGWVLYDGHQFNSVAAPSTYTPVPQTDEEVAAWHPDRPQTEFLGVERKAVLKATGDAVKGAQQAQTALNDLKTTPTGVNIPLAIDAIVKAKTNTRITEAQVALMTSAGSVFHRIKEKIDVYGRNSLNQQDVADFRTSMENVKAQFIRNAQDIIAERQTGAERFAHIPHERYKEFVGADTFDQQYGATQAPGGATPTVGKQSLPAVSGRVANPDTRVVQPPTQPTQTPAPKQANPSLANTVDGAPLKQNDGKYIINFYDNKGGYHSSDPLDMDGVVKLQRALKARLPRGGN